MSKKLKRDKNFKPVSVEEGDEIYRNGIFEFNITKLTEYLKSEESKALVEKIEIKNFCREFSRINETHLSDVDLEKPIIIAEIAPERFNLIDGNHRAEKARRAGIESLPGYRVKVDQHIKFLINKAAYDSYIDYWNEKAGR